MRALGGTSATQFDSPSLAKHVTIETSLFLFVWFLRGLPLIQDVFQEIFCLG